MGHWAFWHPNPALCTELYTQIPLCQRRARYEPRPQGLGLEPQALARVNGPLHIGLRFVAWDGAGRWSFKSLDERDLGLRPRLVWDEPLALKSQFRARSDPELCMKVSTLCRALMSLPVGTRNTD